MAARLAFVEIKVIPLTERMLREVKRFYDDILGLPCPPVPTLLSADRYEHATAFLQEELEEFKQAHDEGDITGAIDGLLDLIYVALGRLLEMGVPPGPTFEEVHTANMTKKRGQTKRSGILYDAVKPPTWKPPEFQWLLDLTPDDTKVLQSRPSATAELYWAEPSKAVVCDFLDTQDAQKVGPLGKPQIALIPYEALVVEAEGWAYGAYKKYTPWNWVEGRKYSEVVSSVYHHIAAWFDRETFDQESNVHHLGLARCNLAMLISWDMHQRTEFDDRRPASSVVIHTPSPLAIPMHKRESSEKGDII